GEDLMHAARDYSDVTSRVIDEEVERILREQESRASRLLQEHRKGLAAVARALLEKETIGGAEVGRLVDEAYGRPVHEHALVVPQFAETTPDGMPADGDGVMDGHAGPDGMPVPGTAFPSPHRRS
ncbi:MAG: hypothetical protein ACRDWW_08295, partial [Acidimicrobiales bacterium]